MYCLSKAKVLLLSIVMLLVTTTVFSQVICYKSFNFSGANINLTVTWNARTNWDWNDAINSIRVPAGWKVVVYMNVDADNYNMTLTRDWVANDQWRNKISRIEIVKISENHLNAGNVLNAGESLVSSNGKYVLNMQDDGNLCVYKILNNLERVPIWCTMKYGFSGGYMILQQDGNLVVYDANHHARWASQTQAYFNQKFANPNYKPVGLILENDGNLSLYNADGTTVWTNR